jgi:hypothetical protein
MFFKCVDIEVHIQSEIQLCERNFNFPICLEGMMNEFEEGLIDPMRYLYETILPRVNKNS